MRKLVPLFVCLALLVALACADDKPPKGDTDKVLRRFAEEFVTLTPGKDSFPATFTMGGDRPSEKPAHEVKFAGPFAIGKYEVTQELYETVMVKNPSRWKGRRNSVEMVGWDDAGEFCRKVTEELRKLQLLPETDVIRLPSEAEWEYACRAGTATKYSFGDQESDLKDYAWFKGNSKGEDPPVGKKKPNAWGLYDMHGYVWEWTADAWHDDYKGAPTDGSPWDEKAAKERVVRGGSWADGADACRSGHREHREASHRSDAVGFRCVRAQKKGAE
jgi:formylglycine-generating enzyme required for sulfatase activity